MFEQYIKKQLNRIKKCSQANMLEQAVFESFKKKLQMLSNLIIESTLNKCIADEVGQENPYAAMIPDLVTEEERQKALASIQKKIDSGTFAFPKTLIDILNLCLKNITNAFLEMLSRLDENKEEICSVLFCEQTKEAEKNKKIYTKIIDIELGAGDTHNNGREVAIVHTDVGKFVYKPHDMRGDEYIYNIVERFFSEFVGIPKCVAFDNSFGVSEFIEKKCEEGEENASKFWYRMGGTVAFIKILGSTDMHVESISVSNGKPYIFDLETIISPIIKNKFYKKMHPELNELKSTSPYLSSILPLKPKTKQLSVLMNTDDEGCAPIVNGKKVSVVNHLDQFLDGYHTAYQNAIKNRDELAQALQSFPKDIPVRVLIRNTQKYADYMKKLYHHSALASKEEKKEAEKILLKLLSQSTRSEFKKTINAEINQIRRGDIPYFYTTPVSHSLFSDGKEVITDLFEKSCIEHAVKNLYNMNDKDELFDTNLLKRAIEQYPVDLGETEHFPKKQPNRTKKALEKEIALNEAKNLLEEIYSLRIPSPCGKPFWGSINIDDSSLNFCDTNLATGLSGMAIFADALSYVSNDEKSKKISDIILNEMIIELRSLYDYIKSFGFTFEHTPTLGETDGLAGMVTATSLLKRYTSRKEIDEIYENILEILHKLNWERYGAPDRILGMAGLLSAVCRSDEFKNEKEVIRLAADRLVEMKTLESDGKLLWKTILNTNRPISGAGHGLIGVAEALFAASYILNDEKYASVAQDALDFEIEIYEKYNKKFGTWADLRTYPPEGIMNGYCSGAPGIGMMVERIQKMGFKSEKLEKLSRYARTAVDSLSLNVRDHLCCGNSAIVEYYLTIGDYDEAGKVLGAMYERKVEEGNYRYFNYSISNSLTPSLLYGISGVGYEMLRYAFPEKILSIL